MPGADRVRPFVSRGEREERSRELSSMLVEGGKEKGGPIEQLMKFQAICLLPLVLLFGLLAQIILHKEQFGG